MGAATKPPANGQILFTGGRSGQGSVPKPVIKRSTPEQCLNRQFSLPINAEVRFKVLKVESDRSAIAPWAIEMKAVSLIEPARLVRTLTGAILGCGGWVLSRGATDTGIVSMLFEFERQACIDIYSVLIAAGIELSQSGHVRFTELCQCTRNHHLECGDEVASIDIEIHTFPPEMVCQPNLLQRG